MEVMDWGTVVVFFSMSQWFITMMSEVRYVMLFMLIVVPIMAHRMIIH